MRDAIKRLETRLRAELARSESGYHRERRWDRKYQRHGRVLGLRSALVILRRVVRECELDEVEEVAR